MVSDPPDVLFQHLPAGDQKILLQKLSNSRGKSPPVNKPICCLATQQWTPPVDKPQSHRQSCLWLLVPASHYECSAKDRLTGEIDPNRTDKRQWHKKETMQGTKEKYNHFPPIRWKDTHSDFSSNVTSPERLPLATLPKTISSITLCSATLSDFRKKGQIHGAEIIIKISKVKNVSGATGYEFPVWQGPRPLGAKHNDGQKTPLRHIIVKFQNPGDKKRS